MTAAVLLHQLQTAGFTLRMCGAGLGISPASKLSDESRRLIRQHKPELLRLLVQPPAFAPVVINPISDYAALFANHCRDCGTPLTNGDCALCATPLPF